MGCDCNFVVKNVRRELGLLTCQPRNLFLHVPQVIRREQEKLLNISFLLVWKLSVRQKTSGVCRRCGHDGFSIRVGYF